MIMVIIKVQVIREIMKKLTNKELVKLYYSELWNKQNKDYIDILFNDELFEEQSIAFKDTLALSLIFKSKS